MADDTALIGLISSDNDRIYLDQINYFVHYCDFYFLELNFKKTKEMIIDFIAIHKAAPESALIKDYVLESVTECKYLGVVIDS